MEAYNKSNGNTLSRIRIITPNIENFLLGHFKANDIDTYNKLMNGVDVSKGRNLGCERYTAQKLWEKGLEIYLKGLYEDPNVYACLCKCESSYLNATNFCEVCYDNYKAEAD